MKYYFTLFVWILFYSCTPKECQISTHDFVIPATFSPAKDSFSIGDTISIVSEFSNEVFDKGTNRNYILDNFKFFPGSNVTEISDTNSNNGAYAYFDVIVDSVYNFNQFNYSTGRISYFGEYNSDSDSYSIKYLIIPKKKGLFFWGHGSDILGNGEDQDFPNKCRGAGIDVYVETNGGADNNVDFLLNSPDSHFNDWVFRGASERFHKWGGYCFYVVE